MKVTFQGILNEIRDLRLDRDRADARLLVRLFEIERDHMDVIRAAQISSFAQFLKSNRSLVEPGRYEAFKTGIKIIGKERSLVIGSHATIVAGLSTNKDGARKFVESIEAWIGMHAGTLPSRETAKTIMLQVDPRPEVPEALHWQDEVAKLRAENVRLRAEVRALNHEIQKLRKRLKVPA